MNTKKVTVTNETVTEGTNKYLIYLRGNLERTVQRRQELEKEVKNTERLSYEKTYKNMTLDSVIKGFNELIEMLDRETEKGIEEEINEKYDEVSQKMGHCGMNPEIEIKKTEDEIRDQEIMISDLQMKLARKESQLAEEKMEEEKRIEEATQLKRKFFAILNEMKSYDKN